MPKVELNFQDGFENDEIQVLADGTEVLHLFGVTTKLLIGFAESRSFELSAAKAKLTVVLVSRNVSSTIELDLDTTSFIGLSYLDGELQYITSKKPFRYM